MQMRLTNATRSACSSGRGPATAAVRVRDHFLVAEPQANVLFRVNDWFRVGLGAGYRLVDSAGDLSDRLRGFTGTVGFQFGL